MQHLKRLLFNNFCNGFTTLYSGYTLIFYKYFLIEMIKIRYNMLIFDSNSLISF